MLKITTLAGFALLALSGSAMADPTFYDVDVTLNADGGYEFSTPNETVYLPPHPEGLVVRFRNLTTKSVVIHGDGAIPHQDTDKPMTPADTDASGHAVPSAQGIYQLDPILPSAGTNLSGYYTIHNVYTPERYIVFNSTTH